MLSLNRKKKHPHLKLSVELSKLSYSVGCKYNPSYMLKTHLHYNHWCHMTFKVSKIFISVLYFIKYLILIFLKNVSDFIIIHRNHNTCINSKSQQNCVVLSMTPPPPLWSTWYKPCVWYVILAPCSQRNNRKF